MAEPQTISINLDLSPAWRLPGVFTQIQNNGSGSPANNEALRLLVFGERLPSGAMPPDTLYRIFSQNDADTNSGEASTVARGARAALAHLTASGLVAELWGCGVTADQGAASTFQFSVAGTATTGGYLQFSVCGYQASVNYSVGDTGDAIGGNLKTALNLITKIPVTFGDTPNSGSQTDVLVGTYNIKGVIGEDCPIRVFNTPNSGITVGPGSLTITGTSATATGTLNIAMGTQTCATTVVTGKNPTATALLVQTALNAADYPLVAGTPTAGVLPLIYSNNRTVRRVSAYVTTVTVTAVQLSGGSATDGSGSGKTSTSYNGSQVGTGVPTLTNALANISAGGSFGNWVVPWTDATELGLIASQVEAEQSGSIQKGQRVTACSVANLATSVGIPTGTSPTLSSSLRYAILEQPDAGQQGFELAARAAAARASAISPATNYDGMPLLTVPGVPLIAPDQAVRQIDSDINTAINSGLTPLKFDSASGRIVVVFGRTTSLSANRVYHDWSYVDQEDFYRRDIKAQGQITFAGKFLKADGVINSANEITTKAIVGFVIDLMFQWENAAVYDGVASLKKLVAAQIDPSDRSKCNVVIPASPKIPFHQLSAVLSSMQPPLAA